MVFTSVCCQACPEPAPSKHGPLVQNVDGRALRLLRSGLEPGLVPGPRCLWPACHIDFQTPFTSPLCLHLCPQIWPHLLGNAMWEILGFVVTTLLYVQSSQGLSIDKEGHDITRYQRTWDAAPPIVSVMESPGPQRASGISKLHKPLGSKSLLPVNWDCILFTYFRLLIFDTGDTHSIKFTILIIFKCTVSTIYFQNVSILWN